jgi:hypothetical protein
LINKSLEIESLVGSPPLAIRWLCASTVSFSCSVSAYVSLIDFGLTAKQPFFSTDLVTLVANEMGEGEGTGDMLRMEIFCVDNLEGQHLLDSKGKHKHVTSAELSVRPEDLSYFTFLCNVIPKEVEEWIGQEQLSISFSLKLPLWLYNTSKDMLVEELPPISLESFEYSYLFTLTIKD